MLGRSQYIWQPLDRRTDLIARSRRRRLKWALHRWVDRGIIVAVMLGIAHAAGIIDVAEELPFKKPSKHRQQQAWISSATTRPTAPAPTLTQLKQVDAWGEPLWLRRTPLYLTFRSSGADRVSNSGDDLVLAVTADGRATMTWGPAASTNAETKMTRQALSHLGVAARAGSVQHASMEVPDEWPDEVSPWLDGGAIPESVTFDDADQLLAELEIKVQDAVDYAEQALPTQLEAELSDLADTIGERVEGAPYGGAAAVSTIRLMVNVGATHHRMNTIAATILDDFVNGSWPEDSVGASYVLSSEDGLDAWNRPMVYARDGIEFTLTSAGPDGLWDSADDPVLWVYHDASSDFFPNWQAGEYTTGLNAISGQLKL